MFTQVFGGWAHIIISIAAIAVISSSMLTLLDGCPRTGARIVTTLRNAIEPPKQYRDAYQAIAKKYGFEVEQPPNPTTDPQLDAALTALKQRLE